MTPTVAALAVSPQVVRDILAEPGAVIARCRAPACGAVTALTIGPGLYGMLRRASLSRLEGCLRCTCGGRGGALEAWPANLSLLPARERLYLFVA